MDINATLRVSEPKLSINPIPARRNFLCINFHAGWIGLLCFLCTILAASHPQAQITTVDALASTPTPGVGHDYIHLLSETVSPVDGSVSVQIAVPVPPSRGFTIPFTISYNSNGVHFPQGISGNTTLWFSNTQDTLSQGGWSYAVPHISTGSIPFYRFDPHTGNTLVCTVNTGYVFFDASGKRASLYLAHVVPPNAALCPYTEINSDTGNRANDFYTASTAASPTVISQATGLSYVFPLFLAWALPTTSEDRNGNTARLYSGQWGGGWCPGSRHQWPHLR